MTILFTQWSAPEKILPILKWPDPILNQVSSDVTAFDESLLQLANNLFATMKDANGIGLAAPQTGNMVNVIVIRIEEDKPLVLVNPKVIEWSSEVFKFNEGCLSVPGFFEERERPAKIAVQCQDVLGGEHELELTSIYAFAIQHEIDHLLGKVFVDGSSMLKRSIIKSKMRKAKSK